MRLLYGVLFVRRCHVVGVTGLRGNDDAGARSSDARETGVAHPSSSQYCPLLMTTPCDSSRLPDPIVALEPLRRPRAQASVNKGKERTGAYDKRRSLPACLTYDTCGF